MKYQAKLKKKNDPMYSNFVGKGKEIPIWAAVNFFDFGSLRTIYNCLDSKTKFNIAKYYSISPQCLYSFMCTLNMFRNVCAHNYRLMKYMINNVNYEISNTNIHANLNLKKNNNGEYIYGKRDLFSVFIVFKYLLKTDRFKAFYLRILNHINHLSTNITTIGIDEVYNFYRLPKEDTNIGQLSWKNIISVSK